jgi:hypothetical protein
MKIKCDSPSTRAIIHKGERVEFDEKGVGTISDVAGRDLVANNPHFTQVKKSTKKETNDG